ncbi:Uncharacterised protein [Vibrio cholerae]|uniref:Transposase n=1 Tax=Vibrio cholerae TaxID=666 RepID=A0A655Y1M2_VIBCL|nr:Uncharacterised protein [Vibrio cholerae]
MYGFRMTIEYRYTYARWVDHDRRIIEDFLGFPHHLHLFFGITVVHKLIDLWNTVKRDLLAKSIRFRWIAIEQFSGLSC